MEIITIKSYIRLFTVPPPQYAVSKPSSRCSVLSGKGIFRFFTDKQGQAASGYEKNLPAVLRPESIFSINLVCPEPYTFYSP